MVDRAYGQIVGAGKVAGALTTDANVDHNIAMGVRFLNTQWTPWAEAGGRAFLDRVARAST